MKTLKELLQKESPFLLIAGPCAIEGEEMAFKIAEKCIEIAKKHSIQYVLREVSKKQIEVKSIVLLVLVILKH